MKNRVFFEPPSRLQVLDKLKHMVRFSDFLLLVSGEKGTGKSTLVEHLKPDLHDTTLHCCVVRSETGLEQEQVLDLLLSQLPSHDDVESDFSGRLKAFYLQLKALREAGQKCLIIVDDAENLSTSALELLLNLHQADSSSASAQLLLLMNNNFADKLLSSKPIKLLEGRLHHLVLEKMSDEETREYIAACHPAAASLPAKKFTQLLQLSEGLPGRVDKLIAGEKVSTQSSTPGTKAFPLPAAHMGGIGLILIGIFAISLWQFFPESGVEPKESVGETVSVPLTVPAANKQEKAVEISITDSSITKAEGSPKQVSSEPSKTAAIDAKQELEQKLALQEQKMEAKKAPPKQPEKKDEVSRIAEELQEVVTTNTTSKSSVDKKAQELTKESPPSAKVVNAEKVPNKEPESKKAEPVKVEPKPPVVASKYNASESRILSWKESGYTLQMLGARSKESALSFIANQKSSEKFHYFSTIYKGAPWYVVIYGEYANRDIANSSIKKLPADLRKMRPWARSVRGVQIDIKKK